MTFEAVQQAKEISQGLLNQLELGKAENKSFKRRNLELTVEVSWLKEENQELQTKLALLKGGGD